MQLMKQKSSALLALLLVFSLLFQGQWFMPASLAAGTGEVNYALDKPVKGKSSDTSAGRATTALDGNPATYWQPLQADRKDDLNVWMTVDLTTTQAFHKTILDFNGTQGLVSGYSILYSNDNSNWSVAYEKNSATEAVAAVDSVSFPEVSARYVKVSVNLTRDSLFKLAEFEVISGGDPNAVDLKSVYFADPAGTAYTEDTTIKTQVNGSVPLKLHAKLSNGEEIDPADPRLSVAITSAKPAVAAVDATGNVSALASGVTQITGTIISGSKTVTTSLWIDVANPELLIADLQLTHPTMTIQNGQPAFVKPGDVYPTVQFNAFVNAEISGEVVDGSQNVVHRFPAASLTAGTVQQLTVPGTVSSIGEHQIRLTITPAGKAPIYDTFYFFSANENTIPAGQSKLAFTGTDGKMVYVPDFKGNKIIDYSNAGYMGGGVKLPDVPVKMTLYPNPEGDDTARIQAAIDELSAMPLSQDGFRGALLLSKGTYRLGGKLAIRASGIVLRGEGQGADGTILYGTGTDQRDLLEIGGARGPVVNTAVSTTIADMFVPTGARSFRVSDASQFQVGDTVMVRRKGNDRWIHELKMDQITDRPGTTNSTQQWTPFDLNFDRVITNIQGNVITIDAPIANSVELRWGGGEVLAYDDSDRIQQVGVENLRVDVNFDPSIVKQDGGVNYYADDSHPQTFVVLRSVKNAWVRDITALHLGYSMVYTARDAKWTTTQDSTVLEMASTLDGGRRYPLLYEGQLGLTQRVNVDTARHSYIVGSRVPGPNVFLDGVAGTEFATSEPHHRWSVGGLFDNIDADIAIQDRGWLGSGHGWAGANWVAWNTKGTLALQGPPTAQNYAIGFTGKVSKPYLPNKDDLRPRGEGYWESTGAAVGPRSLYLQQLQDRLGTGAVGNIAAYPYGQPGLSSLTVSTGQLTPSFAKDQTEYSVSVPSKVEKLTVTPSAVDTGSSIIVNGSSVASGQASQEISLNEGNNTVQIAVYSPSGNASKSYTVSIDRAVLPVSSIVLDSKLYLLKADDTQQVAVTAVFEDNSRKTVTSGVTYRSSNPSVAQIDENGVVKGMGPGTAEITVEYRGKRAEARAVVYGIPYQLVGIQLDSLAYTLKAGETHSTVVQAVYSDFSKKPVTDGVSFQSSNTSVAQVDSNGVVTAVGSGVADIIVEYTGKRAVAKVIVIGAPPVFLKSIDLDDREYSLRVGQTHSTVVYAEYTDRTKQQVTSGANFRSLNPFVANVDSNGVVTALKSGKADILVEYQGRLTTAKVTVSAP
ncbi:Ig-like domain-containing protein [Paenibacillus sp. NPDC056579]|uniref:Ig-like domain-containing protein n=1 Tax=Paenibacillus sp. NPDC056579 TaxID=3345871 RepID=UPI0036907037